MGNDKVPENFEEDGELVETSENASGVANISVKMVIVKKGKTETRDVPAARLIVQRVKKASEKSENLTEDGFERLRSVSPSRYHATQLIHIRGLKRPFKPSELKELLSKFGNLVEEPWLDGTKSQCIAKYETKDMARLARERLHHVKWQKASIEGLSVDFTSDRHLYQKTRRRMDDKAKIEELVKKCTRDKERAEIDKPADTTERKHLRESPHSLCESPRKRTRDKERSEIDKPTDTTERKHPRESPYRRSESPRKRTRDKERSEIDKPTDTTERKHPRESPYRRSESPRKRTGDKEGSENDKAAETVERKRPRESTHRRRESPRKRTSEKERSENDKAADTAERKRPRESPHRHRESPRKRTSEKERSENDKAADTAERKRPRESSHRRRESPHRVRRFESPRHHSESPRQHRSLYRR